MGTRLRVIRYTTAEGNEWQEWDEAERVYDWEVELQWQKRSADAQCIWIRGKRVFALHFANDKYWDAINGWR